MTKAIKALKNFTAKFLSIEEMKLIMFLVNYEA